YGGGGGGGGSGAQGVIVVTYTPVSTAPIAGNANAVVAENSANNPIALNIAGTPASVAVSSAAGHGTATASGTTITYTPSANYVGSDTFQYTATDVIGTSAP